MPDACRWGFFAYPVRVHGVVLKWYWRVFLKGLHLNNTFALLVANTSS